MEANAVQIPDADCPRCGYDLRGSGDWSVACPLYGTCAECGLGFEWSDILGSTGMPRWSVERWPVWLAPITTVTTLLRALVPLGFWTAIRMHHIIWRRRLMAYCACLVCLMYLVFVGTLGSAAGRTWDRASSRPNVAYRPSISRAAYAARIMGQPFGRQDVVGTTAQGRTFRQRITWRLDAPSKHALRWWLVIRPELPSIGVVATSTVVIPLMFLALPVSMRRARVRWRHVGRITAYSLLWPALAVITCQIGEVWRGLPFDIWSPCKVLIPLALCAFWIMAIRDYLRMPRGLWLGLALGSIGLLSGLGVATLWINAMWHAA